MNAKLSKKDFIYYPYNCSVFDASCNLSVLSTRILKFKEFVIKGLLTGVLPFVILAVGFPLKTYAYLNLGHTRVRFNCGLSACSFLEICYNRGKALRRSAGMADRHGLGPCGETRRGSSPLCGTQRGYDEKTCLSFPSLPSSPGYDFRPEERGDLIR